MQTSKTRDHPAIPVRYVTDRDIAARFGVARTTAWDWTKNDPTFPKPVRLSERCTRWRLDEIEAWEASRREATA